MNLFTVTQCVYNPGGTDPNPIMTLRGSVNGTPTAYAAIFWAGIQQAFAVAGVSGVQSYLVPTLLNALGSTAALPVPLFFAAKIPLPILGQGQGYPEPTVVTCLEAMVPAWSA